MSNKTHYIYGLIDPNSDIIRYVGRSMNPFKRYDAHRRLARDPQGEKREWIESLAADGLEPRFIKLDEVSTMEDAIRIEGDWISALTLIGLPLVNTYLPTHRQSAPKQRLVMLETVWAGRNDLPAYRATWKTANGETVTDTVSMRRYWMLMERNAHRRTKFENSVTLFR